MASNGCDNAKLQLSIVRLDDTDCVERLPLTDAGDRADWQRIRQPQRRRLFQFRRSAQLALLSRSHGNATILRDPDRHIRALLEAGLRRHVSTSASGPVCATAVCDRPVGIDIERSCGRSDLRALLNFLGFPGAAGLASLPPGIARFEACMAWTRLEAGLKRAGRGIHDHIAGGRRFPAGEDNVRILASFDWVCAVAHEGEPIEIATSLTDFQTLCGSVPQ